MILNEFDKNKTFGNFIEDEHNKLALFASITIAEKPGGRIGFNPLIICGGKGVGKTHLLNAIGNHIHQDCPQKRMVFFDEFSFINELGQISLDPGSFYLGTDVLIIDNVNKLGGNDSAQWALLGLFDRFHELGKQIVLSMREGPSELKNFDENLLKRFKRGLVADINPTLNEYISGEKKGTINQKINRLIGIKKLNNETYLPNTVKEKENHISLYFDLDEFTEEEIAKVIFNINKLYQSMGGDEIVIKGQTLVTTKKTIEPVHI